jgi:hypothetical protein
MTGSSLHLVMEAEVMDDYSDAPVDDLVRAIRIALEWIEELVEEGDDGSRADEVVDLVRPVFEEYQARTRVRH